MSFLLMVLLTLVCLFASYPQPPWVRTPGESALLTAGVVLLVGLHALYVAQRLIWPLARDPSLRERLLPRYERQRFLHQVFLLVGYGLALTAAGWGWTVQGWGERAGRELLLLVPFLAAQVLSWLFFYDADRAAFRAAQRNAETDPLGRLDGRHADASPFGGRWAYVAFQARQKLALVSIPVLLLIAQKELLRLFPESWQEQWHLAIQSVGVLAVLAAFVAMPWIVRLALGLKPLPAGPLRNRLLAASRRLGFRCSDILLWNTRSGMANAMVIGIVPWVRYVVFTDRLIEDFPEDEVEAVFGHEVGHVHHHHMLYYLGFLTSSVIVLALFYDQYLAKAVNRAAERFGLFADGAPALRNDLAIFPVVLCLLTYIFVVFGFLSRRCERQADVFGCRAVSCGDPDCCGHDGDLAPAGRGGGLCPTGIRTFIRALEKVAVVNGISRERPGFLQSWQHSTIARRVAFLQRVLGDPAVERRFQRRVALVKWALLGFLGGALALLVCQHLLDPGPQREGVGRQEADSATLSATRKP
jgi:Zn-dependent protease with chaperone function